MYARNQCRSFTASNRLLSHQPIPPPKNRCDICGYSSYAPTTTFASDIARHRYHLFDYLLAPNGRGQGWQCLLCDSFVHETCLDVSFMLPLFSENDVNCPYFWNS